MTKLDKNDPLVLSAFTKENAEFHELLTQVLDAGVSRQKFKMLLSAIKQHKSIDVLHEIVDCDFDTRDGVLKAASLANVEIVYDSCE